MLQLIGVSCRRFLSISLALGLLLLSLSTAHADSANFAIDPQDLSSALKIFAVQSHREILFEPEVARGKTSQGVRGQFDDLKALGLILEGTGLKFSVTASNAILVTNHAHKNGAAQTSSLKADDSPQSRIELAQVDGVNAANNISLEKQTPPLYQTPGLTEIIVTAQKRDERLIDVPQSVSVLTAADLNKLGAVQFTDWANLVPGLSFFTVGAGVGQVSLRGLTTGGDVSPTVGIYVDEVPYGPTSAFAGGTSLALDVGLFDINRIEVLRGPQGTLYGASTLGGLLKYVTNAPDTTKSEGEISSSLSGTQHGSVNYNVSAAFNQPLIDNELAVRFSAYESHDGGYIKNIELDQSNVNRSDIYGGRVDLLFTPTSTWSFRLTGFLQDIDRDGNTEVDYTFRGLPLYGDLDQARALEEPFHQQFKLVSATVRGDLGPIELASISSDQTISTKDDFDVTAYYGPFLPLFGIPAGTVGATSLENKSTIHKFTQEIRLSSRAIGHFEWILGGFYTRESTVQDTDISLFDPSGALLPTNLLNSANPTVYDEKAVFGDLTWHLNDRFDMTGGVRYAKHNLTFSQSGTGLLAPNTPSRESDEGVATYLANARYHFNDHTTAYLRYATGYRPGGPNYVTNNPVTGLPYGATSFSADSVKSYEGGFKVNTSDGRFSIDADIYYTDWANPQIVAYRGPNAIVVNAPGGATTRGAELTVTARPIPQLTLTGAFGFTDAKLSQADADLGAPGADRLPNVPRFSGTLGADYNFPQQAWKPYIGGMVRYVSGRDSQFPESTVPLPYHMPAYAIADVRSGATLGAIDWQLYLHNVFDKQAQLSVYTSYGVPYVVISQPRTLGLSAIYHF